jgi:uncharacterized membrane protein YjgN (DUF898 family)
MLIGFAIYFFILKLSIENVSYSGANVNFKGTFPVYLGKSLLGFFLSIITITIYMAWFIKDITKFFINNSSLNSNSFVFNGKPGKLFLILFLGFFLPMIIFTLILGQHLISEPGNITFQLIYQAFIILLLVPFVYLFYKWFFDIQYKDYHLHWETEFFPSASKILLQILLTIITLGIYFPLAYLKLYKYFIEKTIAIKESETLHFGFDLENGKDFIFIWGQTLLSVITLGVYYPWAYCKIGKRFLNKTFLTKNVS